MNCSQEQQQENALLGAVFECLRRDGAVLLPCDTAGRMLDIFLLLHQHWAEHK